MRATNKPTPHIEVKRPVVVWKSGDPDMPRIGRRILELRRHSERDAERTEREFSRLMRSGHSAVY